MGLLRSCPRCGERALEVLSSHSYCVQCNYAPELESKQNNSGDDLPIPPWAMLAVKESFAGSGHSFFEAIPKSILKNNKKGSAA